MRELNLLFLILASIAVVMMTSASAGLSEGHQAFATGNYEQAHTELLPLAKAGDPIAAYYIGQLYWDGKGVPKDVETAVLWLTQSATQGHTQAQLLLALAYENGQGVIQDYREAARWMSEAAIGGNSDAQYYLGRYYRDGRGIVRDDREAYTWIARSVEYGISHTLVLDALLYLGAAREWGRGLPQDLIEAYKWFALASGYSMNEVRIHEESARAMGALTTRLTPAELAEAQRRAEQWQEAKAGAYPFE